MKFSKKTMAEKRIRGGRIENAEIQEDETERRNSDDDENRDMNYYANAAADIPEYRERSSLESEYKDFPQEQMWFPKTEIDQWIYLYYLLARSILTFVQEGQGIPNNEAMENSCTGNSDQYVMDVLHSCEYVPEVALKTLHKKELPRNLYSRWAISDIKLFGDGITRHGKNFNKIRRDILPQKETKDLVEFYYSWKWSTAARKINHFCRPDRSINQRHVPSICYKTGASSPAKICTRRGPVALKHSVKRNEERVGGTTDSKNEVQATRKSARMAARRRTNLLATRPATKRKRNSKG